MIQLPKDLTPAERATLKAWEQIGAIAFFNAILSGVAYIDQFKTIDLKTLVTVILSQLVLGVLTVGTKYLKASGQLPLSIIVNSAANEISARSPAPPALTPTLAAASSAMESMFNASPEVSARGGDPVSAPVVSTTEPGGLPVNTLPNIGAVNL